MKIKPTKKMTKKYCLLPKSKLVRYELAGNNEVNAWFDTKTRRQHRVITKRELNKMLDKHYRKDDYWGAAISRDELPSRGNHWW